jgi:hypothetical protein
VPTKPDKLREISTMKGCRRCTYWQGTGQQLDRDDPAIVGKKVEFGLCRRYAPKPGTSTNGTSINGSDLENGDDSLWPKVASDEWCGEWQPDAY